MAQYSVMKDVSHCLLTIVWGMPQKKVEIIEEGPMIEKRSRKVKDRKSRKSWLWAHFSRLVELVLYLIKRIMLTLLLNGMLTFIYSTDDQDPLCFKHYLLYSHRHCSVFFFIGLHYEIT